MTCQGNADLMNEVLRCVYFRTWRECNAGNRNAQTKPQGGA